MLTFQFWHHGVEHLDRTEIPSIIEIGASLQSSEVLSITQKVAQASNLSASSSQLIFF